MPILPLLNYDLTTPPHPNDNPTLVFIHGLFGDKNNLGVIARAFSGTYPILRIDLRNHGYSFQSAEINYSLMVQDLYHLVTHLKLNKLILIGHSMGGKVAMLFSTRYPQWVKKLIVLDIAPVPYQHNEHRDVFKGLFAVEQAQASTRQQAKQIMEQILPHEKILQFLLKSFDTQSPHRFRFNFHALYHHYSDLMDWHKVHSKIPTLFIRGTLSDYLHPKYQPIIAQQFPNAKGFSVSHAAHWVHADKPESVIRGIRYFLTH